MNKIDQIYVLHTYDMRRAREYLELLTRLGVRNRIGRAFTVAELV